jgi:hypothetical protein
MGLPRRADRAAPPFLTQHLLILPQCPRPAPRPGGAGVSSTNTRRPNDDDVRDEEIYMNTTYPHISLQSSRASFPSNSSLWSFISRPMSFPGFVLPSSINDWIHPLT